jgi:hypothetical protein
MKTLRRTAKVAAVVSLLSAGACAAPGPCDTGKASRYTGYMVARVDIKNPLGFIEGWTPTFRSLSKGLTVKAGDPFSVAKFNADVKYLGKTLDDQFASSTAPVKLDFAWAILEDCDPTAMTLRVVYPIFTSVPPSLNPPSIEQESNESQRPAATGAQQVSGSKLLLTPLTGYNQTRAIFAGINLSDTEGRLQITGQTEHSANSQTSNLSLGSSLGSTKLWNTASWKAAVVYEDTPAGAARFKEGKLVGQFGASTQEFTDSHLIFRYGAALEGGHQQSNDPSASVGLTPNSEYGSLKLYAGITGRPRHGAFSASYGLQLGDTFRSGVQVFKKQLVDLGYNYRFPIPFRKVLRDRDDFTGPLSTTAHRTLGLETRFTAGLIQDAQGVPLAERFLGGNQLRPFVQDDSWVLPGNAFIRSIPENRLGAVQAMALGGTRFYSANATLSFTAWGRPFIPKELAASEVSSGPSCHNLPPGAPPTFPCILNGPFQTSATTLTTYYKTHDPEYIRLTSKVPVQVRDLEAKLTAFSAQLGTIPPAVASQNAVVQLLSNVNDDVAGVGGALTVLEGGAMPAVIMLLTGQIPMFQNDTGALTKSLREASQTALADQLDQAISALAQGANALQASADLVDKKFPDKPFEDKAWKKLAPGHRAIDVFLNELNLYSVAPVAIFDVAHVWPVGQGVRYGIGPGLRLSLVNVNFTFGYAFNPLRAPGEKSGAIFFKLDVTGLF